MEPGTTDKTMKIYLQLVNIMLVLMLIGWVTVSLPS